MELISLQIIIFSVKDKYYAMSTDKVEEISKKMTATKVPNAPHWIEGLINLRGYVVTLVNLSKLLHQDDDICYNNIIIINNNDEKIGLMVKGVKEVMNIKEEDIQRMEEKESDGIVGIVRINGEIINIIDIEKLISKNEG